MAVARREHFGELLEPGLSEIFYNVYEQIPSMIPEIFSVQSSDKPYEKDLSIGAMGMFRKFTGTVQYDRPYVQYEKIYEFPEYADGFQVERKLYDDDMYGIINQRPADLAEAAARRREMDAAMVFNYAEAAVAVDPEGNQIPWVGGDGVPLCSTEHPTKSPDGPPQRANLGSLALNHANLQTTKNRMRQFVDDRGNKVAVVPDTLIVGVGLEEIAWELVSSEKKTALGQSDNINNPNIHQGKYKLIVWDYLADDNRWFLADSRYMKRFLKWYDRVPIEFKMEEDFDTLVAKFRAYMRYACGWSDWFWVYGNIPSS